MTILALDLGLSTGVAWHDGTDVVRSRTLRVEGDSTAAQYAHFHATLLHWLREDVSLVAYEAVPAQAHSGGDAAHRWGGWEACVLLACVERHVCYLGLRPAEWKRAAGLRAGSKAPDALRAAQERWPGHRFTSEDEGVSRWIAVAAARRFG